MANDFYTCGVGCPHPPACLAAEHCERGFVGNAVGFTAGYEKSPRDTKQYAKRDAAWATYVMEHGRNWRPYGNEHDAFDAGWAARKKVEYEMAFGIDTSQKS